MKKFYIPALYLLFLTGCNSVYFKPATLDKDAKIFADRGGFSMKREIKSKLEDRGYKVVVGKANGSTMYGNFESDTNINMDLSDTMNARYIVKVSERKESFSPVWCVFNGFWWWNFNISIADQTTGAEIMSWRGRGCANSSMRKLDDILDKLEK